MHTGLCAVTFLNSLKTELQKLILRQYWQMMSDILKTSYTGAIFEAPPPLVYLLFSAQFQTSHVTCGINITRKRTDASFKGTKEWNTVPQAWNTSHTRIEASKETPIATVLEQKFAQTFSCFGTGPRWIFSFSVDWGWRSSLCRTVCSSVFTSASSLQTFSSSMLKLSSLAFCRLLFPPVVWLCRTTVEFLGLRPPGSPDF